MTILTSPYDDAVHFRIEPAIGEPSIYLELKAGSNEAVGRFPREMGPAVALAVLEAMKLDPEAEGYYEQSWPMAATDAMEELRRTIAELAGAEERAAAMEDAKFMASLNSGNKAFNWTQLSPGTQAKWFGMATAMRARNAAAK